MLDMWKRIGDWGEWMFESLNVWAYVDWKPN